MIAKKSKKHDSDKRSIRRSLTEKKILDAVDTLLNEKGIEAITINAIARTAGIDKVLIYRYFDDLDGLLRKYGETVNFWPSIDELLGVHREILKNKNIEEIAVQILMNYTHALRKRPATLNLLAWECAHRNQLTVILEETRERSTNNLIAEIKKAGIDFPLEYMSIALILSAAINYLSVRGRDVKVFNGLDISSEEGWKLIESAISGIVHAVISTRLTAKISK